MSNEKIKRYKAPYLLDGDKRVVLQSGHFRVVKASDVRALESQLSQRTEERDRAVELLEECHGILSFWFNHMNPNDVNKKLDGDTNCMLYDINRLLASLTKEKEEESPGIEDLNRRIY